MNWLNRILQLAAPSLLTNSIVCILKNQLKFYRRYYQFLLLLSRVAPQLLFLRLAFRLARLLDNHRRREQGIGNSEQFFLFPLPRSLFPVPRSLFPVPRSLFPVPRSLFPVPSSLFPVPSSLFPVPSSPFPLPSSPFPLPSSPFPLPRSLFPLPRSLFGINPHPKPPVPCSPFPIPSLTLRK